MIDRTDSYKKCSSNCIDKHSQINDQDLYNIAAVVVARSLF